MKYLKYKYCLLVILTLLMATSCKEDIEIDLGGDHSNINGTYGQVRNASGAEFLASITTFGTGTGTGRVYYELSKPASSDVTVKFAVSEEALNEYNEANGTNYKLYPSQNVSFANGGVVSIASGSKLTDNVTITVTPNGQTENYAVAVVANVEGGAYENSKVSSYIYLVKQLAAIPNASKGTGIINVGYVEVNDENILNLGEYTMKGTNKPFFDIIHIFAANINVNSKTGRVYLNCNDNVQYILKNADKFIRPLQAKGIKVCLSILGNHDESGMASLSAESAADFAVELKNYVDIYGLDGIDFDDEWSKYNYGTPNPGFVTPSSDAFARLVYETRKVMPDKLITVYEVENRLPTGEVEGVKVTDLYDYSYNAYYGSYLTTGMNTPNERYGPYPVDLSTSLANITNCKRVRSQNYGVMVFYNFKQARALDYYLNFNEVSNVLFDNDVEWTYNTYGKRDVTPTNTLVAYEEYLGTYELVPAQGLFWYTPGPWWDWTDRVKFTLRIEKDVVGSTYKVYGWGLSGDDIPLIMNYNSLLGKVEIDLPQNVVDSDGVSWTYVARSSYSHGSFVTYPVSKAFVGHINLSNEFTITSPNGFKTLSPVKIDYNINRIVDIKGGLYQDVAYTPYSLTKK